MQQVQDQVGFEIETPSDNALRARYQMEQLREAMQDIAVPNRLLNGSGKVSKGLKRARKAQRLARAKNRA